jgi:uncharacterized protein with HEPN domain
MHESNELALQSMHESIEKIERFFLISALGWIWKMMETLDAYRMNFVIIGESVLRLGNSFNLIGKLSGI